MKKNFFMPVHIKIAAYWLMSIMVVCGCKGKPTQQEDKIYSRHLQEHIKLTILNTPLPDDKSKLNLLLLNDGQELAQLRITETLDSLFSRDLIHPLLVVGIHTNNRMQEYGVAGSPDYKKNGTRADKYSAFIDNELYAFIKKKAGVRKFNSVVIAGCSLGGLSAMDIAWNNPDKIDKVGVFSGAFWMRDLDVNDKAYSDEQNRILLCKIRTSRKKPHLKYWFYAGDQEEKSDRDKDGIIDVVDDTRDLVTILKNKGIASNADIVYNESASGTHDYKTWSREFPAFLTWAFGR